MELESLKYVWHTLEVKSAGEPNGEQEILALLQKRSMGPVARMRRNLEKEFILILVTYIPTILLYFFWFEGKLFEIGWLFFLLMLLFAGYFYRKDKLLKEMQCVSCRVRYNLERQVGTLKKYTRFYTLAGTIMIPVMAICTFFIIRWKFPPPAGSTLFYRIVGISWWQNPLFWLGMMVPITIGIYYLNACYVNKLYGRHIRKLQELLQEMEGE
jgi:hypothetical protein